MQSFLKNRFKTVQKQAQNAIDNLIEILEAPIDLNEVAENRLKMACESKKEAYTSITYISTNSELSGRRKREIISALEDAFDTLMNVVNQPYQIKEEEEYDELGNFKTIKKGLPSDIQKSIAQAKRIAYEICISISRTIDELSESEETKQFKIDNIKPSSIIETIVR
jgi:hypothetical protein